MEPSFRVCTLRSLFWALLVSSGVALVGPSGAFADQIPEGWEASNMKPIGYSGLDGHGGAFKMAIKHAGTHWYLYAANFWDHGWDIIDVTDPADPKLVKFIPGPPESSEAQVDLHGDIMITGLQNRAGYSGD